MKFQGFHHYIPFYFPYKIDIQIRLIQSMKIYDALESERTPRHRDPRSALLISAQPTNYKVPTWYFHHSIIKPSIFSELQYFTKGRIIHFFGL